MIFDSKIGEIDLKKVVRLYPAAVIIADGEAVHMSLEWADMNSHKISVESYALVFDFTPSGEKIRDKKEIRFDTKDELFLAMQEVAQFFQN